MTIIPPLDAIQEELVPIESLNDEEVAILLKNIGMPANSNHLSLRGEFISNTSKHALMEGYGISIIHADVIHQRIQDFKKRGGVPKSKITISTTATNLSSTTVPSKFLKGSMDHE
jgi:hypothetical protein